jgi:hypothetical protein
MRKSLAALALIGLTITACTSFDTHVFRTEQTATALAYTGYTTWTNHYITATNSPTITPERRSKLDQQQRDIKAARLRFAASIRTVDTLRESYKTNSAVKGPLLGALATALDNSSNVVWLANFIESP